MIDYGKVKSLVRPEPIIIDDYSVWIHTDVKEVEVESEYGKYIEFIYNKIQYDKNEYIRMMDEKNSSLESQLTDTQIALCEVYEMML